MNKYRRIEISAFRRRVTIVSGEWPRDNSDAEPAQNDDGVSLNDTDSCEPVAPDSPEGQLILVEAMRSLEKRITPEARAAISSEKGTTSSRQSTGVNEKLQSLYQNICQRLCNRTRAKILSTNAPAEVDFPKTLEREVKP